jgi:bile acid:Na+ symporter, BASS family
VTFLTTILALVAPPVLALAPPTFPSRRCETITQLQQHCYSSASLSRVLLQPRHSTQHLVRYRSATRLLLSPEWANSSSSSSSRRIDQILASLTSAFPFFVLGATILALIKPSTLLWTNRGNFITIMLAIVMCGTGLTLTKDDFTVVLQKDLTAVPSGVLCQFLIMPISAFFVGRTLLLPSQPFGSALYLGLCLVGCAPGGTASNLVSLIAKADVALSVLLTSCSTILASVVTPLLVKLLVGSTIAVSGWTLCKATAQVVLLPVLLGMIVNARTPKLASTISRFTPFFSVLLVAMICGGVVAENTSLLWSTSAGLLTRIVSAVLGLHCTGFLVGYLVPKLGMRLGEKSSRTISIETGMQNSALAVVLARSIGAPSIASLPGALSATAHSCLGSILAAYWRRVDNNGGSVYESKSDPLFDGFTGEPT